MHVVPFLGASLLGVVTLVIAGCASIVSESRYPVSITSTPAGAQYRIQSQDGFTVHSGVTPDQVVLRAGAGYFDGEAYKVTYKKVGYANATQTLESSLDGWYWGNIIFGGAVGMLIVDPATGAMFSLPERINVNLKAKPVAATAGAENLPLALADNPL